MIGGAPPAAVSSGNFTSVPREELPERLTGTLDHIVGQVRSLALQLFKYLMTI